MTTFWSPCEFTNRKVCSECDLKRDLQLIRTHVGSISSRVQKIANICHLNGQSKQCFNSNRWGFLNYKQAHFFVNFMKLRAYKVHLSAVLLQHKRCVVWMPKGWKFSLGHICCSTRATGKVAPKKDWRQNLVKG